MTFKDQISSIFNSKKNRLIYSIKKIPGAWEWIKKTCDPRLLSAPYNYRNLEFAMVYSATGLDTNTICPYGNLRNFGPERKFKNCILGKKCLCYFEKYQNSDWRDKSLRAVQKRKQTTFLRYGFENAALIPDSQEKSKKTCLKKYGVDNPKKNEIVKVKGQKTNLERYGDVVPTRTLKVKQKTKETNLRKYGKESINQVDSIKEKQRKALFEKYGVENAIQTPLAMHKREQTNLKNYGQKYPAMLAEIQQKTKQSNYVKYNRESKTQAHILGENFAILQNPEKLKEFIETYGFMHGATRLGIAFSTLYAYHKKYNLELFTTFKSGFETEISTWLNNLSVNYQDNIRSIISPMELDFYFPDNKLAIEFDGIYWHSERGSDGKCSSSYHISKTKKCEDQGIQLIHIFEDEWLNKKDICKSIICTVLGLTTDKIAARKCQVVELTNTQIKQFVNENHLQGHINGKVNLGLEFNGKLVAAMTFGKPRYNKSIEWELLRLVIKKDTKILGGVEKLWSYFQKTYRPDTIVSYCDKRWFSGKVYDKIGFDLHTKGKPTYWYTDYKQRFHRSKYQKHKLVNMGYDKNLTEAVITKDILGLDRIWDCGQDSWVWKR